MAHGAALSTEPSGLLAERGYGALDRLTHRLALGSPALAELSFDLDQKFSGAMRLEQAVGEMPHVFVTGLARAGTTALLRALHSTGAFRSLTYRDMPFPLAPNLWARMSRRWRENHVAQERAHGDGMAIDADSPEALEEVFWRVHAGRDYIRRKALVSHPVDEVLARRFRRYVAAILASAPAGQQRYLSKNNNNILRLSDLRTAFPRALILLPFRHPADHALSLWRQHLHFCAVQAADRFVRSYMDWLVHREFGSGHLRFRLDGASASLLPEVSPDRPDYWLALWIEVHEVLLTHVQEGNLFVCHEKLCADPSLWARLCARLDLPGATDPGFRLASSLGANGFNPLLMDRARHLYDDLCRRADASC